MVFTGHKGPIYKALYSPTNSILATSGKDNTIRLWNNTIDGKHKLLKGHSGPVRALDFSFSARL